MQETKREWPAPIEYFRFVAIVNILSTYKIECLALLSWLNVATISREDARKNTIFATI